MLRATALPMMALGMPVRGGAGVMTVPLGLCRGLETGWGGGEGDARSEEVPVSRGLVGMWPVRGAPRFEGLGLVVRIHFHEAGGRE